MATIGDASTGNALRRKEPPQRFEKAAFSKTPGCLSRCTSMCSTYGQPMILRRIPLTKVSIPTLVNLFIIFRQNCSQFLQAHPIELGGPGAVLQIDESCLSHKQKYHCGRVAENQIWVFGIVDTSYTPSRGYVEIVERGNAATLFPIIQSVCLDGSIIYSDE